MPFADSPRSTVRHHLLQRSGCDEAAVMTYRSRRCGVTGVGAGWLPPDGMRLI
jgi:hypothetical protein